MKAKEIYCTLLCFICGICIISCTQIDFPDEENAPVITILGPDPYLLNLGDDYKEPGAKASDSEDGDLTTEIDIDNSDLDNTTVGEYQVNYSVTDNDGNTATRDRTVKVQDHEGDDSEKPVIRLEGDDPMFIGVGATYVDPGATATDNEDGDITDKIVTYDVEISTSAPDTHIVYYVVEDKAGNVAMETRKVIVVEGLDVTPPVITLLGPNPVNLQVGYDYTEYGATAEDDFDGDLTSQIEIDDSEVNTTVVGTYFVFYTVSDAAGNDAEEYRTVKILGGDDSVPPVITLLGNDPMTVYVDSTYKEPGATATDNVDGNITDNIDIDNSDVNTSAEGNYTVYYSVSDAAGNEAKEERRVNVVPEDFKDTVPPVITIVGSNPINLGTGYPYTEYGATANDNVDGDITDKIDTSGEVNTSVGGTYYITYSVSDAAGNDAEEKRRVNISNDTIPPVITLLGDNPMVVEYGDDYNEPGATAEDNVDGDITDKIVIDNSSVNTNQEGSYKVTYTVSDTGGNEANAERTVNVTRDVVPPVITMKGNNPMTLEINDTYIEPGATATDDVDGDISSDIVIGGDVVNTSTIGTYVVTYNVSDKAGNAAAEKKRTVNVVEQIIPDWKTGVLYKVGDRVTYNSLVYRCIQEHTSQSGWDPASTLNVLWARNK